MYCIIQIEVSIKVQIEVHIEVWIEIQCGTWFKIWMIPQTPPLPGQNQAKEFSKGSVHQVLSKSK